MLGDHERLGLLLVYRLLPNNLPAGPSLKCEVKLLQPLVAGETSTFYAESAQDKPAQDFLATIMILGLSQVITPALHLQLIY